MSPYKKVVDNIGYLADKKVSVSIRMNADMYNAENLNTIIFNGTNISKIENSAFAGCLKLRNVYFVGSENQWKSISIGSSNSYLTSSKITYNFVSA